MFKNQQLTGHLAATITVFIWGITFISTKVLLEDLEALEILITRFVIGLIALKIISPHFVKAKEWKHELYMILAGLCGVTLYFLCENLALTLEYASNVCVITSIAPFFTALLSFVLMKEEKPNKYFFLGFVIAITGICLISYNGQANLGINPLGTLLAVFAPIVWAFYSILIKKLSTFGYNTTQMTARIFFYGIIFMIPATFFFDCSWDFATFLKPVNLLNLLFLGLCASALCYNSWNYAIRVLGAIKTTIYIYAMPVVTVIISIIVLNENITLMATIGIICTILGLFLSEGKLFLKK